MKALIAYVSRTGNTQTMAEYIAEGLRMTGHEVELKKVSEIKKPQDIQGYDAYIFGCPTYHRDMTQGMKQFLFLAKEAGLEGKFGGAFGSYTHSGDAAGIIYDTMENVYAMNMTDMGYFLITEKMIGTQEGTTACQDYGRAFGESLR
ncbi:MAG: flavodoxin domain-containing protein [Desulfovermiculus sp.]|nr:flavodoxin domain-containing protein [Desulfovermiculus sp.]